MCIFCDVVEGSSSREHIIPESLGGSDDLVLPGNLVCLECNNRLSRADEKLIEVLALFRPFVVERTKKGRFPSARTEGMTVTRRGSRVDVLLEPTLVGSPGNSILYLPGNEVRGQRQATIRFDGRLSRGLHKIAFEMVCFHHGESAVRSRELDGLRDYITGRRGGFRHILMPENQSADFCELQSNHGTSFVLPLESPEVGYRVLLQLCGFQFIVAVAADPRCVLRLGRETNQRAARFVVATFDSEGLKQDPASFLEESHNLRTT
jgi:hypothetical protein